MNKFLKALSVTRLYVSILSFCFMNLTSGCGEKYSKIILDLDEIEEVDLNPLTSDIDIIPIKCSVPMDGANRMIDFEDYSFILGDGGETIYCIEKDSVIAILNAVGRGHGEYTYIDDFTYEENTKILFIRNSEKLLKYSVPSMSFLGSSDVNYTTIGMIALNSDEILANCSFWEDESYKECYNGLCIVSTATGEILKRCFKFGYYDDFCLMFDELVKTEDGVIMPFSGVYKNKILLLDTTTGNTKELDSFSFSERWRVPKSLIKCIKKGDSFEITTEAEKRTTYCDGCHYPIYVNSRLTYWCYPEENRSDTPVLVIKDKDNLIKRHFIVSGTSLRINANYVKGDRFIKVIDLDPESIITDPENVSDFGKEIYKVMKAQPFNNPILLSYTVDKNI